MKQVLEEVGSTLTVVRDSWDGLMNTYTSEDVGRFTYKAVYIYTYTYTYISHTLTHTHTHTHTHTPHTHTQVRVRKAL